MSEVYHNIAIAGATGNLGPSVVHALIDAGFHVVVFSRSGNTTSLPTSIKTVVVDLTSHDAMARALSENAIDAFVSNIPQHDGQQVLIDAAITAGVKRFLPSEFGSNVSGNERTAALPVFKGKRATQAYLKSVQDRISWTVVVNGLFLDWAVEKGFSVDLKGTTVLLDDAASRRSMSTLADVGKAVVGVLQHPAETANRTVYVQSAAVSQEQLLVAAKKANPELKLETVQVDTEELLKEALASLDKGPEHVRPAMLKMIKISIFNESYGGDWSQSNDNKLFGIQEKTQAEIEEIVKQYI